MCSSDLASVTKVSSDCTQAKALLLNCCGVSVVSGAAGKGVIAISIPHQVVRSTLLSPTHNLRVEGS